MISPKKHDYISFTRRVVPAVKQKSRGAYGANHDYIIEPEHIADAPGLGYVVSVSRAKRSIEGDQVRTMRVRSSGWTCAAILDESCKIMGEQKPMFDMDVNDTSTSMYDVRGAGA